MTPQQAIVSPDFCVSHPITLSIAEKSSFMSNDKYFVKDVNGNLVFKVIEYPLSWYNRLVILDVADRPILTLRNKISSMHSRCEVFKGKSSDKKDLIFSSKIASMFQFTTKLHIFLAKNKSEVVCDYTLKAQGRNEKSCVVYSGNSSTIVAQLQKEPKTRLMFNGKRKLMVTVQPNVDCAFIVALIVIFKEMTSSSSSQ